MTNIDEETLENNVSRKEKQDETAVLGKRNYTVVMLTRLSKILIVLLQHRKTICVLIL